MMKSIAWTIISFAGICLFSISYGSKFPDQGRICVGQCLSDTLSWEENEVENLEDNLEKFCESTDSNHSFILEKLEGIQKDPQKAYEEVEKCLGNDATKFLDRYKNYVPKSSGENLESTPLLPINQVAVGLCQENELVEFDKLDDDDEKEGKPKAMQCFEGCATKLFKKFEFIFTFLKKEYADRLSRGESNPILEAREKAAAESKKTLRPKPLPEEFKLELTSEEFEKEFKNRNVEDISSLSVMEEKYIKQYFIIVDSLYESNPIAEEKEKIFTSIFSYFYCIKWRCAMALEQDYPIKEFLSNVLQRKVNDPHDLIKDFE